MTYDEARIAHAGGNHVTCGLGVRKAYTTWNTVFDLERERTSVAWRTITWQETIREREMPPEVLAAYYAERKAGNTRPNMEEVMMKLKAKTASGQCHASRCVTSVEAPETLCAKHKQGDLPGVPPPAKGDALVRAEIEPVKDEQLAILRAVAGLDLETSYTIELNGEHVTLTGLEALGRLRENARVRGKELELKRKTITTPMDAAKKAVMDLFRPAVDSCEAVVRACTDRLEQHARALQAARTAALVAVQAQDSGASALLAEVQTAAPMPAGTKVRQVLEYEITDFSALPDMFKVVNDAEIRRYLSQTAGLQEIPGVVITKGLKVTA